MNARQLEIDKYRMAYTDPRYAMGSKRRMAVDSVLHGLPAGTLLDVGTGRGETLLMARAAGHVAKGTEVVPALLRRDEVQYAEAHALPFAMDTFDYVTCFDVLEHLIEQDIRPALVEMKRVARRVCIVTAADFPHIFHGVDLHVSRRPEGDWDALIRSVWGEGVTALGIFGISPAWRLDKPWRQ